MKASFVIVNYNRKEELLVTIAKTKLIIKNQEADFEIIIVDNASNDESAAAVKALYNDVIVIENKVNTGAPAWNLGFAQAKGKYFIILDDDSHMESGLNEALDYLDNHSEVGVLALNIIGGAYNTNGWTNLSDTVGFIGCGAIWRKELYQKIGGYAEWIFLYTNEWDYGIRCLDAGYKLRYFQDCHIIHRTSSINRTNKRLKVFSVRNEMAIIYKYFDRDNRNKYIFRVFINNLKGVYGLGFPSVPWYFEALKEFFKLKKILTHTPVKKEVQEIYSKAYWSTQSIFKKF